MEDEINLLDYIRLINQKKRLIITFAVALMLMAFIYSLLQPKIYKAVATLMPISSSGGGLSAALSAIPFLDGGARGDTNSLISILQSNTLANNVAQDYRAKYPAKLPDSSKLVKKIKDSANFRFMDGIINISVNWEDPKVAAEIANAYINELGKFLNGRSLNINFQVIDPAVPPLVYAKPRIKFNTLVGGIWGIFLGVFMAFFADYWKKIKNEI